jgi:hypothetical protein
MCDRYVSLGVLDGAPLMLPSKDRVRDKGISNESWFTATVALDIPHWYKPCHRKFSTHPNYRLKQSDTNFIFARFEI